MYKWLSSLFVLILFLSVPTSTPAYETWDQFHLEKGVGNSGKNKQYYFIHSSAKPYNSFYPRCVVRLDLYNKASGNLHSYFLSTDDESKQQCD
ncbi:hypothetical protein J2Z48_001350 [Croceifilum oryzae]|uniref:Secreted protein n=1 Tax=Croceifilum oryzae TaxID=1553429 RepID=A0AAJ1WSP0_9BACL|nr:hypothetical protein [Croceifilum oryzae]